ncbi:Amine oxidase [Gracilaria domingensis]|nr:Amine oxidase [Gracilaria domingensis]
MFAEGAASLPAGGIGAISRQLAEGLPQGVELKLNSRVTKVSSGLVSTDGATYTPHVVVVATECPEAARLLTGVECAAANETNAGAERREGWGSEQHVLPGAGVRELRAGRQDSDIEHDRGRRGGQERRRGGAAGEAAAEGVVRRRGG